jgi:hypothetical protein
MTLSYCKRLRALALSHPGFVVQRESPVENSVENDLASRFVNRWGARLSFPRDVP